MNIIDAIMNIVHNPITDIKNYHKSNNRINNEGESLEEYVKDLFAGSFDVDEQTRNRKLCKVFSYLGNKNNPLDAMLRKGDAIEVKKLKIDEALQLNSSNPKHTLKCSDSRISAACRDAEKWDEKDIIYIVGKVKNNSLKCLCMIYGLDYCASEDCYKKLEEKIKNGIEQVRDIEFMTSNELGRINNVDPLGITYMRIRGMWVIENPWKVFNYVYQRDDNKEFSFMCIINDDKWKTFKNTNKLISLSKKLTSLEIKDVQVKNPDNPAQLRNAKLIVYTK